MKNLYATNMLLMAIGLFMAMAATAQPTVDNRVFKKWIIVDEDGSKTLFDLTDKKHWKVAQSYNEEWCKMFHNTYEPGVFYSDKVEDMRVTRGGHSYGTVEYKGYNGQWHEVCTYEDLTDKSVTFMFEGEFVWHAVECKDDIKVVEINTEEINVSDMVEVYNFYDINPNLMKDLFAERGFKQINRHNEETGYSYETWGRGIKGDSWIFEKTSENALAIHYLYKKGEYNQASIIFSDKNLIPAYELQLGRKGYYKKRVRNLEGMEETTYASDEWTEGGDEPCYTITNDGMGLYHLSFTTISK